MPWFVKLAEHPLPRPRFLAEDEVGYHTTSLDRATSFKTKREAEAAKTAAAEEWPEAEFEVVRCQR